MSNTGGVRVISILLALLLCVSVETTAKSRGKSKASKAKKRGQFVFAPIPTTSPAVGAGLVSPPTAVAAVESVALTQKNRL